ncbi:hypothetical protein [Streptomyces sp. HF10]|uniref:hypothetical protein n=1 Tax=Streptomyces sp. HF10 TaxID=2692233 RepID=UPI0013192F4D|nr:hypothetical protein [Streptomyces sp. HF10]QHC27596.1 hypothetical protein GR129_00720 [Streptomyces sp. HF10]
MKHLAAPRRTCRRALADVARNCASRLRYRGSDLARMVRSAPPREQDAQGKTMLIVSELLKNALLHGGTQEIRLHGSWPRTESKSVLFGTAITRLM